jgi:folylpolyglutamate synthase/dihydropteroate synthase
MADKDVAGVIAAASRARALEGAMIVCTSVDLPRAMPADALAEAWREALPGARVEVVREPAAALDLALAAAGGPIVVAGSLYLVGAARARLVDDPALRDPVAA